MAQYIVFRIEVREGYYNGDGLKVKQLCCGSNQTFEGKGRGKGKGKGKGETGQGKWGKGKWMRNSPKD